MSLDEYKSVLPGLFDPSSVAPSYVGNGVVGENDTAEQESTSGEDAGKAPRKRFADIVEYHAVSIHGPEVKIMPVSRFNPSKNKASGNKLKYEDYVLVLRRTWEKKGKISILTQLELEIQSRTLCDAFRKIAVDMYEDTELNTFPLKLQTPFRELFFYRHHIKEWVESNDTEPQLRHEAEILLDFIRTNGLFSSIVDDHDRYSKDGKVVSDMLWTIYPPNSLIVVTTGKLKECWICRNVEMKRKGDADVWIVSGFTLGFDGEAPGLIRKTFSLPVGVTQALKISELPVIPSKLCHGWIDIKQTLLLRAKRLESILGPDLTLFKSQRYASVAFDHNLDELDDGPSEFAVGEKLDERVIPDFVGYREQKHELPVLENFMKIKPPLGKGSHARGFVIKHETKNDLLKRRRTKPWDISYDSSDDENDDLNPHGDLDIMASQPFAKITGSEKELTSRSRMERLLQEVAAGFHVPKADFQLLFPALVPAFGLKSKRWHWLLSDHLQDVTWNPTAFESLQLEPGTKALVQTLVKGHSMNRAIFDDVMPGKGQGLIFLLHGGPGLGKTLTAGSVADYLERPLYSISGGELSTEVKEVESRMDIIFTLTKRWNAVVLLDEADVLLCKRASTEIQRNAIVGVFLRKLEYFEGVLFLTTNRKQDFDDAFKGRIHVTIPFPDLSPSVQSSIWENFIDSNKKRGLKVDDHWDKATNIYLALGKLQLNGRTIRNILRTAVACANAESEPLELRHVLAILTTELLGDTTTFNDKSSSENKIATNRKAALEELVWLENHGHPGI